MVEHDGIEVVNEAWETARGLEPDPGRVVPEDVERVRRALDRMAAWLAGDHPELDDERRRDAEVTATGTYARAAALAQAGGDSGLARAWLAEARRHASPTDRPMLDAAARDPERYRVLVHARFLVARQRHHDGIELFERLAGGTTDDAIRDAARAKLGELIPGRAPRPTLWRWNGCGLGFYGKRDRRGDGTYVTTHCLSLLWIPLVPVGAYRVQDAPGGYFVIARDRLSRLARVASVVAIIALIVGLGAYHHYRDAHDPGRLARERFDAAVTAAEEALASERGDREAARQRLDDELGGPDLARVGDARAARAGAAIVRLAAAQLPAQLTAASLDQAVRVVRRYQALPPAAQRGAALEAVLAQLEAWSDQLEGSPEAQLVLLHEAGELARAARDDARVTRYDARAARIRLAVADKLAADWPMDALGVLADGLPDPQLVASARAILERVVDAPSLLDDARADIDWWLRAVATDDPLARRVSEARARAAVARAEVEDDDVTPAALAAMAKDRPWDQRAALALALRAAGAGQHDEAAARLARLGPPGLTIRDARAARGHLAAGAGRLDEADDAFTRLLTMRVARFARAAAAYEAGSRRAEAALESRLRAGDLPPTVSGKLAQTNDETEQRDLIREWATAQLDADPTLAELRAPLQELSDVVSTSLALGSVKLRRAHALTGAERDRLLADAERTFLAIRTQAEGEPEFELGLGEIYARLGKHDESEAAFGRVLDRHEPTLELAVAKIYRELGNTERARAVATGVFERGDEATRQSAAVLLALMALTDEEAEGWYRKSDVTLPFVRTALVEIEAGRLLREGKLEQCARRFADAARAHLAMAVAGDQSSDNNAALAYQRAYGCSGDPAHLRLAATTLERAYRTDPESPIIVGNLADVLQVHSLLRVLGARVDARALRLDGGDAGELLDALSAGPERDAVLADLAADTGWRRQGELLDQLLVLAPSNAGVYRDLFDRAELRRDRPAAEAVLARLREARAIDTSGVIDARARWEKGELDQQTMEGLQARVSSLTELAARPRLDARTRAAALYLASSSRGRLAVIGRDVAGVARARDELTQAAALWPALAGGASTTGIWLDEAGLTADAARWSQLRRARTSIGALAELAAASDPLVGTLRASPAWAEAAAAARADTSRPGLDDLRFARLLGDAALIERTRTALDNPMLRLALELRQRTDPTDPSLAADQALLATP